jgi:hypothetical protein
VLTPSSPRSRRSSRSAACSRERNGASAQRASVRSCARPCACRGTARTHRRRHVGVGPGDGPQHGGVGVRHEVRRRRTRGRGRRCWDRKVSPLTAHSRAATLSALQVCDAR